MKEVEVKILEIDSDKVRTILRQNKAVLKNRWGKEITHFYPIEDGVIRLRKYNNKCKISMKSGAKTSKGFKTVEEQESAIDSIDSFKLFMKKVGFTPNGYVEKYREDWKFKKCMVSILKLPGIPSYLEIEGNKKDIEITAKIFGYKNKDFCSLALFKLIRKYKINTKFLKF